MSETRQEAVVLRLPPERHKVDMSKSDELSRLALANGWEVRRRTATYFAAIRKAENAKDNRFTQITVWVRDEVVVATRSTVIEETDAAEQVERWLTT